MAVEQRPIRVALVHYRDDPIAGGSLRVGETLANHLDPEHVEAHLVFAYGKPGPVTEKARIPCHFLNSKGPTDLASWPRARRFFADLKPDIIHYGEAVVWLNMALLGTGYTKLIHVHGRPIVSEMSWRNRVLMRVLCGTAHGNICITETVKHTLVSLGWARAERCWTLYNSIETASFAALPTRTEARQLLGLPADAHLLAARG